MQSHLNSDRQNAINATWWVWCLVWSLLGFCKGSVIFIRLNQTLPKAIKYPTEKLMNALDRAFILTAAFNQVLRALWLLILFS